MKRLLAAAFLLLAGVAVWRSAIDTPDPLVSGSVQAADGKVRPATKKIDIDIDPTAGGSDSDRQRLIEQLKAKVELMSDEEVEQALESTGSEIRAMRAKQQLDQTAEMLKSIIKSFDGTPSAAVAGRMLAVHSGRADPIGGDAPFYPAEPIPSRPLQPTPDVPARPTF